MTFREVSVIQVKEVLRWWLRDDGGVRWIAAGAGVDRETARRYIEAAVGVRLEGDGGEDQSSDALIGAVCEAVRPARPHGHGVSWELLCTDEAAIKGWVDKGDGGSGEGRYAAAVLQRAHRLDRLRRWLTVPSSVVWPIASSARWRTPSG